MRVKGQFLTLNMFGRVEKPFDASALLSDPSQLLNIKS